LLAESAGYTLPWTGRPVGEQSATIVWDTLRAADRLPLLWNVYPLHPHRPGEPQSNRRPTAAEVAIGLPFVLRLMELFAFERIAAVGRVAAEALRRAFGDDRQIWALRHPAHGGAQPFATGMLAVLAGNDPAAGSTPP
jgi:uracil-DNA glycosylase